MDKSSWYYSRNIGGDIRDNVPPSPNIGGTCPPCPIGIDAPDSSCLKTITTERHT